MTIIRNKIYETDADPVWEKIKEFLPFTTSVAEDVGEGKNVNKIWALYEMLSQAHVTMRRTKIQTNLQGNYIIRPKMVMVICGE